MGIPRRKTTTPILLVTGAVYRLIPMITTNITIHNNTTGNGTWKTMEN